jgi:hypothetical protein
MSTISTMPNASAISRILSNAHFIKSTEAKTKIRGYHLFSEGFHVENGSSSVLVRYEFGTWSREGAAARRDEAMAGIVALLRGKGFDVTTSALQPNLLLIKKAVAS